MSDSPSPKLVLTKTRKPRRNLRRLLRFVVLVLVVLLFWFIAKTCSARYRPGIITFLGHDPGGEPETFGERIRAARELEGLSKPQLAQRLGISTSTIHAWEADTVSRPTTRVVNIFEDYLNEV